MYRTDTVIFLLAFIRRIHFISIHLIIICGNLNLNILQVLISTSPLPPLDSREPRLLPALLTLKIVLTTAGQDRRLLTIHTLLTLACLPATCQGSATLEIVVFAWSDAGEAASDDGLGAGARSKVWVWWETDGKYFKVLVEVVIMKRMKFGRDFESGFNITCSNDEKNSRAFWDSFVFGMRNVCLAFV